MTPYATFLYFGILLYLLVPFILDGIARPVRAASGRAWIVVMTLVMTIFHFWDNHEAVLKHTPRELWMVLAYVFIQWLNATCFLRSTIKKKNGFVFFIALTITIVPFFIAKFTVLPARSPDHPLFGFLGISYITFRTIDVLIGIRDGVIKKIDAKQYCCYLLFFPTMSSGPIDRYRRFEKDWNKTRNRSEFLVNLDRGIQLIAQGFLYKFIIAALIDYHWIKVLEQHHGFKGTVLYMYAYTFYLFFDFAGYSAFAIGFAKIIGFDVIPNFRAPFFAQNIRDFWDRWHISLSWWFRDHVYMRFVMLATKKKWFQSKYTGSYLGYFLTMQLMGVWHGITPHYLVYGAYHGLLLIGYDVFSRWNKQKNYLSSRMGEIISMVITFHVVCFGLLIFSGRLF